MERGRVSGNKRQDGCFWKQGVNIKRGSGVGACLHDNLMFFIERSQGGNYMQPEERVLVNV